MSNSKFINHDICTKCGGACCQKSGCDYFVSDFKVINEESLINVLDSGNVSIVSTLCYKVINGRKALIPFLYLRARNTDRGVIDLFSFKKRCSMLREDGCFYDDNERPSGGISLVPGENRHCHMEVNKTSSISNWIEYQDLLTKLVEKYTKKSVTEKLKEDLEEVLIQIMTKDYEGIKTEEIYDMLSGINLLVEFFPDVHENARAKALKILKNSNSN